MAPDDWNLGQVWWDLQRRAGSPAGYQESLDIINEAFAQSTQSPVASY